MSEPPPVRTSATRSARHRGGWRRPASILLIAATIVAVASACTGDAPLPGDPLRLATGSLPDPVLAEPYRGEIAAAGGLRPYAFRLDSGALPPGLRLQGGVLVGEPTELGRFEFTVAVTDANLARNLRSYVLTVRDVPVPTLTVVTPETEVRDRVVLRVRIDDARALRAIRLRLSWDDPSVRLAEGEAPTARRGDVVVFHEEREGGVAIDLAVLGDAWSGSGELVTLALAVDAPTRLSVASEAEVLFSGRHAYRSDRFGAPRAAATDPAADPDADGGSPQDDDPDDDPDDGPGDESEETPDGAPGDTDPDAQGAAA